MRLTKKNKKIVDDEGSTYINSPITMELIADLSDQDKLDYVGTTQVRVGRCDFCGCLGVIVDRFPRRGYGKREYTTENLWNWIANRKIKITNDREDRDWVY